MVTSVQVFRRKLFLDFSHHFHACYIQCPSLFLDLAIKIISGKEHKLWSPSPCNFLQTPVTLYLLDANIIKLGHDHISHCKLL